MAAGLIHVGQFLRRPQVYCNRPNYGGSDGGITTADKAMGYLVSERLVSPQTQPEEPVARNRGRDWQGTGETESYLARGVGAAW